MITTFVLLVAAAGYGLFVALLLRYRDKRGRMELWLIGFLVVSAIVSVMAAVLQSMPESLWLRHAAKYGWAINLIFLLFLTLDYGDWGWRLPAIIGAAGWLLLLALVDWLAADVMVVSPAAADLVRFPQLDIGGLFFLLAWAATAISLVILTLHGSARARLPLHANRLLYWAAALSLVFVGQVLLAPTGAVLSTIGVAMQLLGAGALLYGIVSYRLLDVRGLARRVLGYILLTVLTAGVIIVAILAAMRLTGQISFSDVISPAIGLALLLAIIYQFVHHWLDKFITRFVINQGYDPAVIVETYARAIGNILDVETLTTVAIGTINEVLETRRGAIMLVTERNNTAVVWPVRGMGPIVDTPMSFPQDGPIFSHFVQRRQPLLQYDVDVLPEFQSLNREQRQWLAELDMNLYVPIMTDELPIGLLAIGSKRSGELYNANELRLLQTLAGQTVVALTNARLFGDMRRLNEEIQQLNEDLRHSNERLQHMDQVKTDFITIASHELRTPLTQVKGYTDILDAMIEDGVFTVEEGRNLIRRTGRATEQLEKVISAMLDVSQIDVDAMSLNLTSTRLDTVLRIAIEPLAEAMRERKLTLTVQGIRNAPPIMADFQRLVQAVSNLVYNAVKYTPDGGRITINAEVLKDEQGVDREIELVFADTGVGVDLRDHGMIFEKFFRASDPQLHSTGSTKFMGAGPGLGLSIVRGIVEAHSGRIWVESDGYDPVRCPGSQFHLVLPINPPSSVS